VPSPTNPLPALGPVSPLPRAVSQRRARIGLAGFGVANVAVLLGLLSATEEISKPKADQSGTTFLLCWLVGVTGMGVGFAAFGIGWARRVQYKQFVAAAASAADWPPRPVLWIGRLFQIAGLVILASRWLPSLFGR